MGGEGGRLRASGGRGNGKEASEVGMPEWVERDGREVAEF